MSPEVVSAISAALSAIITLITAVFVAKQIAEMRRATFATAFKTVYDMLQSNQCRADRGLVLGVISKKTIEDWTADEKACAERVCQNYDSVGIMCRQGFIPTEVVADSWGDSLRRSWTILSPLVSQYRVIRNSQEFWDDYEWLAKQADSFKKRIHAG